MAPTPQQLAIAAAVKQMVAAAQAPVTAAQKTYDQGAAAQTQQVTGLTQALAGLVGGIAPQTQATYDQAAQHQAAFAKGFSERIQESLGQNASNVGDFLRNVAGSPDSQISQVQGQVNPPGVADTLYALHGYIPATTLTHEGAAWTANAQQLPAFAAAQGQQQIGKIQADQRTQDATFANQLAEIGAKAPEYTRQLTNDAFDQAYKTHSANRADQKFVLQQQVEAFNQKYKIGQQQISLANLNLNARKFALTTLSQDRSYALALANLGLRQRADQRAALVSEYTLQNGGFTPGKIAEFKGKAYTIATDGVNGYDVKGEHKSGFTYSQAILHARRDGIPLSIALAELNQVYKPGVNGRPLSDMQLSGLLPKNTTVGLGGAAGGKVGLVNIAPAANRAGVALKPIVTSFVAALANAYGGTLTIGTGTNHNRMTVDGNVSDHWDGHAADIPATGATLTKLGQDALILAGMDPVTARKQKGGLFNLNTSIGRVQIIFNTKQGGNHYTHLHVGIEPNGS